ncbi:MAG: DUF1573 domain-containing protein [Candidatus Paceibacterota bacterium]|jgi:hypothetical protein
MKNTYILGVLAIVLIGVGIYFSSSGPVANSQGKLETSHLTYDFGQVIMNAGNVEHKFVLQNNSSEPITVGEISTSCMCTTVFMEYDGKSDGPFGMSGHDIKRTAGITIEPGKSADLKVVFDPAAHGPSGTGFIQRNIYINTNSIAQPQVVFEISGTVNL